LWKKIKGFVNGTRALDLYIPEQRNLISFPLPADIWRNQSKVNQRDGSLIENKIVKSTENKGLLKVKNQSQNRPGD